MTNVIDKAWLERQRRFSLETFGPGLRTANHVNHIRKELIEIEAEPLDLTEWADVILLAIGGALRVADEPQDVIDAVMAKLERNIVRRWPDWRTVDPDQPVEHDRSGD